MRVALLSYNAHGGDAIGNQVAEKLAFFLERGADVRVFVQSTDRLHPGVRPHHQHLPLPEPRGPGWRFLSSADLVIVEYSQYYSLLDLLPLLAGKKARLLFDYHGVTPSELWGPHNREALEAGVRQRGLVWCADAVAVHSPFTHQELLEYSGFPSQRFVRLGYPIDTNRFSPGISPLPLREELGLGEALLLLFVGRLAPNKRVPLLVEALARLTDVNPPIHAVILGDTSDTYHGEMRNCRETASRLGVDGRVHFLGQMDEQRLLAAYRTADLFVMPSRHEGFCIPVVEAMACGLPVVAAHCTALPHTVAGAGLTFTPDDADDLARQVRRLLSVDGQTGSELLAEEMRRRGRERALEFDRAVWRERFGEVVERLLDAEVRPCREEIEVRPRWPARHVNAAAGTILLPVRVVNRGTHAVLARGPARHVLRCRVLDAEGRTIAAPLSGAPLPGLLMPGRAVAASLPVPVPDQPGTYEVALWTEQPEQTPQPEGPVRENEALSPTGLQLVVESEPRGRSKSPGPPLLDAVQTALVEAERLHRLPDDYTDVSEGLLASWKRRIKRKLLGNFKLAYVDVLSRQQTTFNQEILKAVQELAECFAAIDHVGPPSSPRGITPGVEELLRQLAESRAQCAALEERLRKLETLLLV
jgi:glycosyltransferase involved in cell wall biosynthesis